jgi:hypothetical protein
MTSDRDDLEGTLRENLQLRRKLAAEVTGKGPRRRSNRRLKKLVLEISILLLVILAFALSARLLGGQASILSWQW